MNQREDNATFLDAYLSSSTTKNEGDSNGKALIRNNEFEE